MWKTECNAISYAIRKEGVSIPIECRFLESGKITLTEGSRFYHPMPHVTRIFILERNMFEIETQNGSWILKPGSIYLLPINLSFTATYHESLFYYFHVSVRSGAGLDVFDGVTKVLTLDNPENLYSELTLAYNSSQSDPEICWQPILFSTICRFCSPLIHHIVEMNHNSLKYHHVIEHIHTNLNPKLTVNDLAEKFSLTRSALSKGFQRAMGVALKEYIIQRILQKARELLVTTEKTVQEIAFDLGYDDPYYFQRIFKKYIGHTPIQHRKGTSSLVYQYKYPLWESEEVPRNQSSGADGIIK